MGAGLWNGFERIDEINEVEDITEPIPENSAAYEQLLKIDMQSDKHLAETGDRLKSINP